MKHTTLTISSHKASAVTPPLQMLTCYDYQNARMLDETELDIILVGDSLGNVILGLDTTIPVTLEQMTIFSQAVKRGAKNKFVVADLPFGTYSCHREGVRNAVKLFQKSGVEAVKLEGAFAGHLELVRTLTETGIPVMGHIGLTPQSVHQQGGYYIHGKSEKSASLLEDNALALEKAGAFAIVLECVKPSLAKKITSLINIPTIGIGSGNDTDGQVLVLNDLLKMGPDTLPRFVKPVANLYETKKQLVTDYLKKQKNHSQNILQQFSHENHTHH